MNDPTPQAVLTVQHDPQAGIDPAEVQPLTRLKLSLVLPMTVIARKVWLPTDPRGLKISRA
jgi:hypothetical protein